MKNIVLAAAIAVTASTAFAGNMSEPVMDDPVTPITEEASGSSGGGLLIPLLVIALLAAASNY